MMPPLMSLVLVSPGPRRLEVILAVKELLGLTTAEARALVGSGNCKLLDYFYPLEAHAVRGRFEQLGATLRSEIA